mmetsp:Transcript_5359/g.13716  ORF Transcript_5359/g.13716 Transcript_5359/m.13716 type:complete len:384 (-) Transcript_5359:196-1347(-)
MTDIVVMEITAEHLVPLLLRRQELRGALTPGERAMLPWGEQMVKLWQHPSISDEAMERANLSLIEKSQARVRVQQYLLGHGAVAALELLIARETRGVVNALLAKCSLALLIGSVEEKENPMLEVDDDIVFSLKDAMDATAADEDWYGHRYNLEVMMIALRLLCLNDRNKSKLVSGGMIPFMLEFLSQGNKEIARSATAILLDLSFGMRARWLLRPILKIWYKHVEEQKVERDRWLKVPPPTSTVDIAAPAHVVHVQSHERELVFEVELLEAAYEGGVGWLQRLVEDDLVDVDSRDQYGASAMHLAAIAGNISAMDYLDERGLDVNCEDRSGCTPLAWLVMARQLDFGIDPSQWPDEWRKPYEWLKSREARAKFVPLFAFPNSV